jgi:hypothetical protein
MLVVIRFSNLLRVVLAQGSSPLARLIGQFAIEAPTGGVVG